MNYHVRPLPRAIHDVDRILDWMANEKNSLRGAARWLDVYESALAGLAKDPHKYPAAQENEEVEHDLRQILFGTKRGLTYRAVFIIENDEVFVVRVRGPGQANLQPDELGL